MGGTAEKSVWLHPYSSLRERCGDDSQNVLLLSLLLLLPLLLLLLLLLLGGIEVHTHVSSVITVSILV